MFVSIPPYIFVVKFFIMRKLILAFLIVISLASCKEGTNLKKSDKFPTEVLQMTKKNVFDTVVVIKTDKEWFVFEKGDYKESIDMKNEEDAALGAGILIGVLLTLVAVGFISFIID